MRTATFGCNSAPLSAPPPPSLPQLPEPTRELSDTESEDEGAADDDAAAGGGEAAAEDEDSGGGEGGGGGGEDEDEDEWLLDGHEFVGQRVARIFGGRGKHAERVVFGRISKWAPADEEAGDEALFHLVHDDGDEEDLDEDEAVEGIAHLRAQRV